MKTFALFIALFPSLLFAAELSIVKDDYLRLATEMELHLEKHILKLWYPHCVDRERGGFIQDYAEDWTESRDGNKTIVYQSRLTWMAAQVALSYPEKAKEYIEYSNHGLDFLADKMWDKENGGFYWTVDANGKPTNERSGEKHVYGISFGLYAASVNYKATKNPKALELATKTFEWLNTHALDGDDTGYTEALDRAGNKTFTTAEKSDFIGTAYGYKSMNTHIHLLESFTAYYAICPSAAAKHRLQSLYKIVHDKVCVKPGAMHMYFNRQFEPVPDLDSFGHDLETAYLLIEAAETLHLPQDAAMPSQLVNHALMHGWDDEIGGFYNEGSMFRKAHDKEKVWWVQAEGLNVLLLMHEIHSEWQMYWKPFLKEWEFIKKYQIDATNNGWISYLNEAGSPSRAKQMKSDQWKDPYHQGRAMINVIERLKRMGRGAEIK